MPQHSVAHAAALTTSNAFTATPTNQILHTTNSQQPNKVLILDVDEITCNLWEDSQKYTRLVMKDMSSGDIKCPAHIVTIVSAILSIFLVLACGISIYIYIKFIKNRKKNAMTERKNVNERIVPQQVDKLELERYLAAQEMENEYRALRQWELTTKEQIEEPDHYEKFDDFRFDTRRTQKPHVVYV